MIRVRLADTARRDAIATFLRFGNLRVVLSETSDDAFVVDFASFDLDPGVQVRVVRLMLEAWHTKYCPGAAGGWEVSCEVNAPEHV